MGGGGTGCGWGKARKADERKNCRGRGGADAAECLEVGARSMGEKRVCGGGTAYALEGSICPRCDVARERAAVHIRAEEEPGRVYEGGSGGRGKHAGTIHTIFMYQSPPIEQPPPLPPSPHPTPQPQP